MRIAYQYRQSIYRRAIALPPGRVILTVMVLALAGANPLFALTLDELYGDITNPFAADPALSSKSELSVSIEIDPELGGDLRHDSFEVITGEETAGIRANTRAAALYAADQLAAMLAASDGALTAGVLRDRSVLEVRALHLQMRRMTLPRLLSLIDKARYARMNTLLLYIGDDVKFTAAGIVPLRNAMSKEDLVTAVAYARASGMRVIPNLPLLTKQHRFFKQDAPELMYNNATYDPRNPETMRRIYAHLEEIIELIQPDAIHIGHDEVEGTFPRPVRWKWTDGQKRKWLSAGDNALPAELYLQHILDLHAFLTARSVETWMWGDMLLNRQEFPVLAKHRKGAAADYEKLRTRLPRDIVICDWHYKTESEDFPTTRAFADLGYRVLGATRENPKNIAAFSRYMAGMGDDGMGMIATLWSLVNRAEPELVDDVIARSGREFWAPGAAAINAD